MVRLVLIGDDLANFQESDWTDHYTKILVPEDGDLPAAMRTYTVRAWDPVAREVTIDVIVHGQGRVGPWADVAEPGDEVVLRGQGGAYAPSADFDWHLLIGDESALPAILAALEHVPAGSRALAFIEVADASEQQEVDSPGEVEITWIHRGAAPERGGGEDHAASDGGVFGAGLVQAVRTLDFPTGRVQVFLHGEAGMVRELRRHLRGDRGVPREDMSVSGYWRLGRDDEAWRAEKSAWKAAVEQDEQQGN